MLSKEALAQSAKDRVAPLRVLRDGPTGDVRDSHVLVHEIYTSLQGESTAAGELCTFVRLAGCHLRCTWCDTEHAFSGGDVMSVPDLANAIQAERAPMVELTGGEPLLQKASFALLTALCDAGLDVYVETSGGVSIDAVDRRVKVILDVKCPDSGESARNVWSNLDVLWPGCEVKFVIASAADYAWSKAIVEKHGLLGRTKVLFSPAAGLQDDTALAEWIIADRLAVRFQVQMHKVLWGDKRGV